MKSSIKKLRNCKKIVEVKLTPERVKDEFEKVYGGIKKAANVPGYRVGKAPRDLLESHYGKTAKEEVIKGLVPETYREILEQYKLDPIGYPDITDVKLDLKEGFSFRMLISAIKRIKTILVKNLRTISDGWIKYI